MRISLLLSPLRYGVHGRMGKKEDKVTIARLKKLSMVMILLTMRPQTRVIIGRRDNQAAFVSGPSDFRLAHSSNCL